MNQLTIRLFVILSVITFVVMSLFFAARYYYANELMKTNLQERSVSVAKRVASSVQLTIWNIYQKSYDRQYSAEFATAILDAEMQSNFVQGIKIYGNFGHLFTGKIKIAGSVVVYSPKMHDKLWLLPSSKLRYPIKVGSMTIGNVEISYNDTEFANNLNNTVFLDMLQILIISLLFITSLFLVLKISLISPMQSLQVIQEALNSLDEAVFIADEEGKLIEVNPSYIKVTGFELKNILNAPPKLYAKDFQKRTIIELVHLSDENRQSWEGEILGMKHDGISFPGWLKIHKVKSGNSVIRYVGVFTNIAEKKEAEKKLYQLAYFDTLTQVHNRYSFMQRLDAEILTAQNNGASIAVLYMDLDNLKWTNDKFGHDMGDKLLVEMAKRFQARLRQEDTLYRIGGDEFTIIVNNNDKNNLQVLAQNIIKLASAELIIEGEVLRPGVSIGIAAFPETASSAQELIIQADSAMLKAKRNGRSQEHFFSKEEEEELLMKLDQCAKQELIT